MLALLLSWCESQNEMLNVTFCEAVDLILSTEIQLLNTPEYFCHWEKGSREGMAEHQ